MQSSAQHSSHLLSVVFLPSLGIRCFRRILYHARYDLLRNATSCEHHEAENRLTLLSFIITGLLAYFYDQIRPGTSIELNQCRFNHMGMDVLYRGAPSFNSRSKYVGKCRNNRGMDCEDCQVTPLDQIYSIHYTQCRKPWNCIGESSRARNGEKEGIPADSVIVDHCLALSRTWNEYRSDLEQKLLNKTGNSIFSSARDGSYMKEVFQGHCRDFGGKNYIPIAKGTKWHEQMQGLYDTELSGTGTTIK